MEQKFGDIIISVKEPVIDSTDPLGYVTYEVSGKDNNGSFNIRRRFRDFFQLRERLVQRFPGIYIPPVASKKVTGNTEDRFVEKRRKFLNYFLTKISQKKYLFYSDILQMFLRGDAEFQKQVKTLSEISYVNLLQIYQKEFSPILDKISSAEVQKITETEFDFMKKAEKRLQKLRDQFREVGQIRKQYTDNYNNIFQKTFPEYEQNFVIKHVNQDRNKLIISGNEEFNTKFSEYKQYTYNNALEEYSEMVSYELKELRAFCEAINSRQDSQNRKEKLQSKRRQAKQQLQKLKEGKTTLKSIFTKGDKDAQIKQLQENIPKWENQQQSLGKMIDLMNASIYMEIANYKNSRALEYSVKIKQVSRKKIKQLSIYAELIKVPIEIAKN